MDSAGLADALPEADDALRNSAPMGRAEGPSTALREPLLKRNHVDLDWRNRAGAGTGIFSMWLRPGATSSRAVQRMRPNAAARTASSARFIRATSTRETWSGDSSGSLAAHQPDAQPESWTMVTECSRTCLVVTTPAIMSRLLGVDLAAVVPES